MSFYTVLAQAIMDAAPRGEERDEIGNRLWGAHMHHSVRKKIGLLDGLSEDTRAWLEPVIRQTTEAYRRTHHRELVPDLTLAENGEHIQSLAEAIGDVSRRFGRSSGWLK